MAQCFRQFGWEICGILERGNHLPLFFYVCLTRLKRCRTIHLYGRVLVTFCEHNILYLFVVKV
nr:MAG TPA: hypothetical protein [Caudoviricetes sp.]